jgi:hypothetical protein
MSLCAANLRLGCAALPNALRHDIIFGREMDKARVRRDGKSSYTPLDVDMADAVDEKIAAGGEAGLREYIAAELIGVTSDEGLSQILQSFAARVMIALFGQRGTKVVAEAGARPLQRVSQHAGDVRLAARDAPREGGNEPRH